VYFRTPGRIGRWRAIFALGFFSCAAVQAQEYLQAPRFPQPAYFRRHFAEALPHVELSPPMRLEEFAAGNKLEISLRSYLELVLANNTDIQIQRLSIEPQRDAITRALAPFDPSVTASFQSTRSTTPTQNTLEGAATLSQLRQPLHFAFQKMLESGAQYFVGFDGNKTSSNDTFAIFNPALSANFSFGFTQPLLRNRGRYVNRLDILIARSRYEMSRYNLEDQLTRLLQVAENIYWAVIEARENLRVQEKALQFLDTSLKRYEKEVELGAMAPVEIYQPQQVYASQEVVVTEAQYRLQQAEDALRAQIGADLNPAYQNMPLVLTETLLPQSNNPPLNRESLVETALRKRPDLKVTLENLVVDDMSIDQTKNALLPDLSLNATYSSVGRGGQYIERANVFSGDSSLSQIVRTIPGGLGDALNQAFGLGFPIYAFSLNLRLPIRDHKAAADLADAAVSKRMNTLRARAIKQQIRLDVLNAASQVDSSRVSMRLAQASVDFAQKRVDTELKKYDLGDTTVFFLLDAQNSLTRAEAELVTQLAQYHRNLVNLLRATGQLLEERGAAVP